MAKAKPGGAPAWMVTFADLMSLLLVLFVLMLSFAEMDLERYKAIAGAIRNAFGMTKEEAYGGMQALDGGLGDVASVATKAEVTQDDPRSAAGEAPTLSETDLEKKAEMIEEARMEEAKEKLTAAIGEELKGSGISVERSGDEVVIRFPSEIAFPSGTSVITRGFAETVEKLIPTIRETQGSVVISGHTDNVPVSGGRYSSNWQLSAERATSVLHHVLSFQGMDPARFTIQGYGDSRPLVPNDSPENRAQNRRVEVSIIANKVSTSEASETDIPQTDPANDPSASPLPR